MTEKSEDWQEGYRFALARLETWGRSHWRFMPPAGRSAIAGAQIALREAARYLGVELDPSPKSKGSSDGNQL